MTSVAHRSVGGDDGVDGGLPVEEPGAGALDRVVGDEVGQPDLGGGDAEDGLAVVVLGVPPEAGVVPAVEHPPVHGESLSITRQIPLNNNSFFIIGFLLDCPCQYLVTLLEVNEALFGLAVTLCKFS